MASDSIQYLGFEVTGVASGFCSGGDRTGKGWDLPAARPADDVGVFPDDDDVGVLLAIAAHVIGFAGFTAKIHIFVNNSTADDCIIAIVFLLSVP